ncbi:MAG TPA: DinB family protein [Ilumatobacteraceae bacterium]|nr:DinB family protein [Ilumatobacteraceae bacterium]
MSKPVTSASLDDLVTELHRAWAFTDALWLDLTDAEVRWRPNENSSAIGWHLGHQAAVAHFMVRNLLAAEPSPDPELDALMDSSTPEPDRGGLPDPERLARYRSQVCERVIVRVDAIRAGEVGAPEQLSVVAAGLVRALVNHEYQHDQWIAEVRSRDLGHLLPTSPVSTHLTMLDGYTILRP